MKRFFVVGLLLLSLLAIGCTTDASDSETSFSIANAGKAVENPGAVFPDPPLPSLLGNLGSDANLPAQQTPPPGRPPPSIPTTGTPDPQQTQPKTTPPPLPPPKRTSDPVVTPRPRPAEPLPVTEPTPVIPFTPPIVPSTPDPSTSPYSPWSIILWLFSGTSLDPQSIQRWLIYISFFIILFLIFAEGVRMLPLFGQRREISRTGWVFAFAAAMLATLSILFVDVQSGQPPLATLLKIIAPFGIYGATAIAGFMAFSAYYVIHRLPYFENHVMMTMAMTVAIGLIAFGTVASFLGGNWIMEWGFIIIAIAILAGLISWGVGAISQRVSSSSPGSLFGHHGGTGGGGTSPSGPGGVTGPSGPGGVTGRSGTGGRGGTGGSSGTSGRGGTGPSRPGGRSGSSADSWSRRLRRLLFGAHHVDPRKKQMYNNVQASLERIEKYVSRDYKELKDLREELNSLTSNKEMDRISRLNPRILAKLHHGLDKRFGEFKKVIEPLQEDLKYNGQHKEANKVKEILETIETEENVFTLALASGGLLEEALADRPLTNWNSQLFGDQSTATDALQRRKENANKIIDAVIKWDQSYYHTLQQMKKSVRTVRYAS